MRSLLEKLKESLANEETKRYLHFLTLPFVTILLIIVIVIADKPDKNDVTASVPPETETVQQPETDEAGEMTEPTTAVYQLKEAAPEVLDMMEKYFKARKSCDVNRISEIYGGGLSSEQLEKERVAMEDEVRYYQNFHNLACYTVPGLTGDSLVVYARYDIKFRQAETEAPSMMACYAKSTGDGSWRLVAELTPEEAEYLDSVNRSDEVQAMAASVNAGLRSALESDENLLAVYYSLTAETEAEETDAEAEESEAEAEETEPEAKETEPEGTEPEETEPSA